MLSKREQSELRGRIFRHLDGIAVAPVAYALHQSKMADRILQVGEIGLDALCSEFGAYDGYLNVGLRALAAQGWLDYRVDNKSGEVTVATTENTESAFALFPHLREVVLLHREVENFNGILQNSVGREKFFQLLAAREEDFGLPPAEGKLGESVREQILYHIEGNLVGPLVVKLAMGGMFHKYFMEASFRAEEYHEDHLVFEKILDFLFLLGWFKKKNGTYQFTDAGLFFAKRASAYGVTVSYLPTFRKAHELLFGDPTALVSRPGQPEKHVDREMNVWGSGGAHSAYFKKVDEIIVDLFNRPVNEQPKGVLDMGCGNGAFLIHIFDVIEYRTYRGKILDQHPLILVGADYNESALKVTRSNLIGADIWAKVVWGDIGRPDLLAQNLKEDYGVDMSELLNTRTFLDHNRIWEKPENPVQRESSSTGAFAYRGKRLNNNLVEENLLQHFKKWAPYIQRFGLLVIELHTIDPKLAARNIGKTTATAYDTTHGLSDQFIVELDVFLRVAEEAGLYPDERLHAKFPNSDLATISVNLLKGNSSGDLV